MLQCEDGPGETEASDVMHITEALYLQPGKTSMQHTYCSWYLRSMGFLLCCWEQFLLLNLYPPHTCTSDFLDQLSNTITNQDRVVCLGRLSLCSCSSKHSALYFVLISLQNIGYTGLKFESNLLQKLMTHSKQPSKSRSWIAQAQSEMLVTIFASVLEASFIWGASVVKDAWPCASSLLQHCLFQADVDHNAIETKN